MRNLSVPVLFVFLFTACGDKPVKAPVAVSTDTSSLAQRDTLVEETPPAAVKSDDYAVREPIIATVKQVLTHIPDGYSIIDTCTGDLNQDEYTDLLLVLRQNGEDSIARKVDGPVKRKLLLLTGSAEQTYTLAAQSENVVYCNVCGGMMGDPYQQLVIKNGYFTVEHYGGSSWRWTRNITFKYSKADSTWYLHKDGGDSFHATDPEKVTTKVRTVKDFGKVPFAEFDIYKDEE